MPRGGHGGRRREGFLHLRRGYQRVRQHGHQQLLAALLGQVGRVPRVEGRVRQHSGQQRGFRKGEVGSRFAEVAAAGGFQAIEAVAEIGNVEIPSQHPPMAVLGNDLGSQQPRPQTAAQGRRLLKKQQAVGEGFGDGKRGGSLPKVAFVAPFTPEIRFHSSHHCRGDVIGQPVKGNRRAAGGGIQRRAVGGHIAGRRKQQTGGGIEQIGQRLRRRQVGGDIGIPPCQKSGCPCHEQAQDDQQANAPRAQARAPTAAGLFFSSAANAQGNDQSLHGRIVSKNFGVMLQ